MVKKHITTKECYGFDSLEKCLKAAQTLSLHVEIETIDPVYPGYELRLYKEVEEAVE